MHYFFLIIAFLSIYMFIYDILHPYNLVRPNTLGAYVPRIMVWSPNTFTSVAPRTYSTICIGSESCLGSIVGFARLLCFGTLRSIISAKVALGELLRLCPSWAGPSTSVEKAKTDCHDKAWDRSLFERFFESLKAYAALSGELVKSGQRRG